MAFAGKSLLEMRCHRPGILLHRRSELRRILIPPHKLGSFMGDRTQEFCTVYNMVRLADYLFRFTGDAAYLDYIEKICTTVFLHSRINLRECRLIFYQLRQAVRRNGEAKHMISGAVTAQPYRHTPFIRFSAGTKTAAKPARCGTVLKRSL